MIFLYCGFLPIDLFLLDLLATGCFFSSHNGLQSFEHPLQKLKPVPRIDSQGQALGSGFKVDMAHRDIARQESMHRVGSEANWAESI